MEISKRYICSGGCGRTRYISKSKLPLEQQRTRELPATAGFCIYCEDGIFLPEEPPFAGLSVVRGLQTGDNRGTGR